MLIVCLCSNNLQSQTSRGSKVFPAFRQFLQSTPEERDAKKAALVAELEQMNIMLAALEVSMGKVW